MFDLLQIYRETVAPLSGTFKFLLVMALLIALILPQMPKTLAYGLLREGAKKQLEFKTRDWQTIKAGNFIVRYQKSDEDDAALVLQTAGKQYSQVAKVMEYSYPGKILLVVYPDKKSLNISFGWDADVSAMGVYWAGAIRVLTPAEWAGNPEDQSTKEVFQEEGPMAHELTHLLIDYRTGGNYSRWLTEGMAQYVEREVTGFQFPPVTDFKSWYSLKKLSREFDNLPDQSLAYYESLKLVDFLVSLKDEKGLLDLLDALAKGKSMTRALEEVYGLNMEQFEQLFRSSCQYQNLSVS